jgi:hypothetical protein
MATHTPAHPALDVLIGARAISQYIFGTEEKWKQVYPLRRQLGLFRLGGKIAGRPKTIAARIAAEEAAAEASA